MSTSFRCKCGHEWQVPEEAAGRLAWCRNCKKVIHVPGGKPETKEPPPEEPKIEGVPKVLLVDSDVDTIMMAQDFLPGDGYEVAVATTVEDALDVLEEFVPDVALIAAELPADGGYELCNQISVSSAATENAKQPLVLMMAAEWDKETISRARESGAFGYIHRPSTYVELLDSLRRSISQ